MTDVIQKPEWQNLQKHYETEAKTWHMRNLFQTDPDRFTKFRLVKTICLKLWLKVWLLSEAVPWISNDTFYWSKLKVFDLYKIVVSFLVCLSWFHRLRIARNCDMFLFFIPFHGPVTRLSWLSTFSLHSCLCLFLSNT